MLQLTPEEFSELRRVLRGIALRIGQRRRVPLSPSDIDEMVSIGAAKASEMLDAWDPLGECGIGGFVRHAAARSMVAWLREESDPCSGCANSRLKQEAERAASEAAQALGQDAEAPAARTKVPVDVLEFTIGGDVAGRLEDASWARAVRARVVALAETSVAVAMAVAVSEGQDADEVSAVYGYSPHQGKRQRALGLARLRGDRELRRLMDELTGGNAVEVTHVEDREATSRPPAAPVATPATQPADAAPAADVIAPAAPAAVEACKAFVVMAPRASLPWRLSSYLQYGAPLRGRRPPRGQADRSSPTSIAGRPMAPEADSSSLRAWGVAARVAARTRARGSPALLAL